MGSRFGGSKRKIRGTRWRLGGRRYPGSTIRILLGLSLIPWLLSSSHADQSLIPGAPALKAAEDLSGCFRRVRFDDSIMESMNQSEPWPEPYQIYCFMSNGTLRSMSSTRPMEGPVEKVLEVMERMPRVQSYSVPAPGVVVTRHDATGNVLAWLTSEFVTHARVHGHEFEPGDVHMAIIGKDDRPLYHRFLQRVGEQKSEAHSSW